MNQRKTHAALVTASLSAALFFLVSPQASATDSWTVAPTAKTGGSNIRVSYIVPVLQPGQAGTVQLRFSGVRGEDASVAWRPSEGNTVSTRTLSNATEMALPRHEVTELTLTFTAGLDGMAYLDVFTTQNGRGSAQSIPIKVGSGVVRLKREGTRMAMPSGEMVMSLPSQAK